LSGADGNAAVDHEDVQVYLRVEGQSLEHVAVRCQFLKSD
jgi:hypothetical protein